MEIVFITNKTTIKDGNCQVDYSEKLVNKF